PQANIFKETIFLKRSGGGACPTPPPPPSHPRAARTLRRGAAALIRARLHQSSTRRNVETENVARRSADNISTGSQSGGLTSAGPMTKIGRTTDDHARDQNGARGSFANRTD